MEVTVLGCRGSTPATGTAFVRYGGDTSSVAIARSGDRPRLLLDAGTGLGRVAELLDGEPFRGAILLTHLHWDHTHGLPFAPAVDRDDAEVDLYVPAQGDDPLELVARALGPPHFPITPDQLRGSWRFHSLDAGRHVIEGFQILAADVPHKGGRTFGYRVSGGPSSVTYIPDYWLTEAVSEPADLVAGTDLLMHDSQHLASEMAAKSFLGHSSVEYVVELARRHDVGRVSLFHHDPQRTDSEIDQIIDDCQDLMVDVTAAAAATTYHV